MNIRFALGACLIFSLTVAWGTLALTAPIDVTVTE